MNGSARVLCCAGSVRSSLIRRQVCVGWRTFHIPLCSFDFPPTQNHVAVKASAEPGPLLRRPELKRPERPTEEKKLFTEEPATPVVAPIVSKPAPIMSLDTPRWVCNAFLRACDDSRSSPRDQPMQRGFGGVPTAKGEGAGEVLPVCQI
jgi:hypothetical protein